jgi:phosphoribosylformimino-5-aminoimidazole carboxamide ribotide isomerase
MQIIPVIDLKDGIVVHAVRGNRAAYQPIHQASCITSDSDIDVVLAGFLKLYAFKRFYIADLNAITGSGNHQALIDAMLLAHPDIEFWVDSGSQLSEIRDGARNMKWVIGTESQQAAPCPTRHDFILSLDFKNDLAADHAGWLEHSQYWPEWLIVMTLNRVGSNSGPDFAKLHALQQQYPQKQLIAAGGIRHQQDLTDLKIAGMQAALVATALHNGSINLLAIQNH